MDKMQIFARMTKVDEAARTVEGIAVQEITDRANEKFDYDRSKPHFVKWSDSVSKASDGKSVGNLRAMHGKTVAGKLTEMVCDDSEKCIKVKAHVVDDNEWKKVMEGCYTGFSIGGKYEDKWPDPAEKGITRYEANPSELSLVDVPCGVTSTFSVVKADGVTEERHFDGAAKEAVLGQVWTCAVKGHEHGKKDEADNCVTDVTKRLRAGETVEGVRPDFAKMVTGEVQASAAPSGGTAPPVTDPAPVPGAAAKRTPEQEAVENAMDPRIKDFDADQMAAFEKALSGVTSVKMLTELVTKIAAREDVKPSAGENAYGDVKFADEANKKYPIDTAAHIRAAWNYINKTKNAEKYSSEDVEKIKGNIVKAWKDKIDSAGPPSASKDAASKGTLDLFMRKGLYTIGTVASLLESLQWSLESYQYEQEVEKDDSLACTLMENARDLLAECLREMAAEEVAELMNLNTDVEVMEMSTRYTDLIKYAGGLDLYVPPKGWDEVMRKAAQGKIDAAKPEERGTLAKSLGMEVVKAGARHSKADKDRLQAIHDHSVNMGADCDAEAEKLASGTKDKLAKASDDLQKVQAENTDLKGKLTAATAEVTDLKKRAAPGGPAARAVDRINDTNTNADLGKDADKDKPVLKADGSVDGEATARNMIKNIHAGRG